MNIRIVGIDESRERLGMGDCDFIIVLEEESIIDAALKIMSCKDMVDGVDLRVVVG